MPRNIHTCRECPHWKKHSPTLLHEQGACLNRTYPAMYGYLTPDDHPVCLAMTGKTGVHHDGYRTRP
jgi:hypothetical protein